MEKVYSLIEHFDHRKGLIKEIIWFELVFSSITGIILNKAF